MEHELKTPLNDDDINKLKAGDTVYLTGKIYTARDSAHKRIIEEGAPIDLEGVVLFHAGPIILPTCRRPIITSPDCRM